jgi:hypothetical protein
MTHHKVVMGRMRGADGRELPPEVETRVWQYLAAETDRALIRNLPPDAAAALAALGKHDEEAFREAWSIIRKARLGVITPEQADEEIEAILRACARERSRAQ